MTTSATQPVVRQRTKPARPISLSSILRPRPEGNSTPSGATTRRSLLFWSAVFSTMTRSVRLGRSSAATFWTSAHCSALAPGGTSQRICQSPCVERTAPCAKAEPAARLVPMSASARAPAAPMILIIPAIPFKPVLETAAEAQNSGKTPTAPENPAAPQHKTRSDHAGWVLSRRNAGPGASSRPRAILPHCGWGQSSLPLWRKRDL